MVLGGSAKSLPWSEQKELTSPEGLGVEAGCGGTHQALEMSSGSVSSLVILPPQLLPGALLGLSPFLPFIWFGGLILF